MRYALLALAFALPASALAAPVATSTFAEARDLVVVDAAPTNAYYAAGTLAVSAPTKGDLSALAGTIVVDASTAGDALLAGGTVEVQSPVGGDLRALGGRISLDGSVGGDAVMLAPSVEDSGTAQGSVFVVAENATLSGGAKGPVIVYANNVALAGTFAGDVHITAAGRVSVEPGAKILGTLTYQSPEQASIASSAIIKGGVTYTGTSYLPSSAQAHALALAAAGVFLLVKILGALILAGLIAGLFPELAQRMAAAAFDRPRRSALLTTLLGFALIVATPVLLLLLALTFVGLGLAVLFGLCYVLLLLLAFIYSGIILGVLLARRIFARETILWHDGVLGMFVVMLVALVPIVGLLLIFVLTAFAAGALASIFYGFAFTQSATEPML